jgi:2-polyprenyl-6-methoxyphenol hydroxylase-like FAD-dependent oxidoreductase
MMPQWDFLDILADEANTLPNFNLMMSTEATGLIDEDGKIVGINAKSRLDKKAKPFDLRASLTIAADGRGSVLRDASGLPLVDHGAPIDVFWMRLPRTPDSSEESLGRASKDGFLVMINRGEYWQCAMPLAKGNAAHIRELGLPAFRQRIAVLAPNLAPVVDAVKSWDDVKLLTVQVNRLTKWWREGFL